MTFRSSASSCATPASGCWSRPCCWRLSSACGPRSRRASSSELSPYFTQLAALAGQSLGDVQAKVFGGPGKIIRTILGGEQVNLDRAMDLLSIGYVHPLVQTIFCVWAVGRASGALAGELDRGTMELLMAQPVSRPRLVLAHFGVDLVTIPRAVPESVGGHLSGDVARGADPAGEDRR